MAAYPDRLKCFAASSLYAVLRCLLGIVLWAGLGLHPLNAQTAPISCTDDYRVSVDFTNGAGWDLCWESKRRENIVLSDIRFKSPDNNVTKVIASLRLAQLHVTYDDSNITYNDVTQFGLGGGYVATLSESECPDGELIDVNGRAGMCRTVTRGDDAYRTTTESRLTEALTLNSISLVGAYSYLVTWKLFDDGSIAASVGAAGALQRSSDNAGSPYGRELEGVPGKSWLSHTHNYYWRVDFDLGDDASNDVVSEVSYKTDLDGRRARVTEKITEEAARKVSPESMRAWYITDGDVGDAEAKGYLIEPLQYGHKLVRSEVEPFTDYDFFVTRQRDCEKFISENSKFNPQCGDNILDYVNGESVVDEDVVVWHRVSFHHVPRNEDRNHMHSHWDGFVMQSRNLSSVTPGHSGMAENSPPVLVVPLQLLHKVADPVSVELLADDSDGDALTYSASGLPEGVSLSSGGVLTGAPVERGNYRAVVSVADNDHTTTALIQWQVSGGSSGAGAVSLWWFLVLGLGLMVFWRR